MVTEGWLERGVEHACDALDGQWEATPLHGTGGGVHGSGVARLRSDDDTVVVKVVARNDARADAPASFRRELDAYRSTWLRTALPSGLAAPELRWSAVTDEAAIIVLEHVAFDDPAARSVDWYRRLARLLGELAAHPTSDVPAWASRGFVAHETDAVLRSAPSMFATPAPLIRPIVESWRPLLERLIPCAPALVARLEDQPAGFAHLDAFSRNVAEVDGALTLIDWAYSGMAPLGADAAGIVAMTAMHVDADRFELSKMLDVVVEAYADGLAAGGRPATGIAFRETVDALLVLRWTGFLAQANALGDGLPGMAETVTGRPVGEVVDAWHALSDLVSPLVERLIRNA